MGQSGAPEHEGVRRVTSPVTPPKMEVVMGKCFPLSGPGFHFTSPSYPDTKTTRSDIKMENHLDITKMEKPQKETGKETLLSQRPPQTTSGGVRSVQQNGTIPNTHQVSSTCQNLTMNHNKKMGTKEQVEGRISVSVQPGNKATQPILRRTQSAATSQPEVENNNKPVTDSLLTRIKAKVEQLAPGKDEVSGKEAWDITQKKKSLMREEFFKIPYEECNKEAAMSLGGRLNKSEPRLNTICKDRKKRNSLSYKRRVHFDLDEDKDLDDVKPSRYGRSRRNGSQSFSDVGPPKKVVVSIYSIDDPAKRVQQVQLPSNYCQEAQGSPVNAISSPTLASKDRNYNQIKTGRPTDLDSLHREEAVSITVTSEKPVTVKQENTNSDSDSTVQDAQRKSSLKSTSPRSTRRTSASGFSGRDGCVKAQGASPTSDTMYRRYSLPPPLQQISVRPRQPSAHFTPDTTENKAPTIQHHKSGTLNSCGTATENGPVPAPRSNISVFRKSQSVQDDTYGSTTADMSLTPQHTLQRSRPDSLKIDTSSSQKSLHTCTESRRTYSPQQCSPSHHEPVALMSPSVASQMISAKENTSISHISQPTSQHTLKDIQTPIVSCTPATTRTHTPPHTPIMSHTATTLHTDTAPCTPTISQTPTTPVTPTNREGVSPLNPPIPKPRKRISVSQQTTPPPKSPAAHTSQSVTHSTQSTIHTSNSVSHTTQSASHTPKPVTYTPQPATYTPKPATYTPKPATYTPKPATYTPKPATYTPKPATDTSQSATYNPQPVSHTSQPASHTSQPALHTPQPALHTSQPASHTPQHASHTPQSASRTPRPAIYILQPSSHTPQPSSFTSRPTNFTAQPSSPTPQPPNYTSKPTIQSPKPTTHTSKPTIQFPKATTHTSKPFIQSPKPSTHTVVSPAYNSQPLSPTTQSQNQKPFPKSVQSNSHIFTPHTIITTDTRQIIGTSLNNKVPHKINNKENQKVRSASQKTDDHGKGNSINILMTKGESYSKHNIILNSHVSSTVPSVTVRKIFVPVSAPARCSPSPTPSCASSSCSFGSSGSSSGCFSGSPSPTPTPSPTRIRASGVPTDL